MEATISKKHKATQAKRSREILQQARNKEKEERRAERRTVRAQPRSATDDDPDLAGIVAGPQPSHEYEEEEMPQLDKG